MTDKPAWLSGKAAIEHVMKATGCSREEAQRVLLRKVAAGKVRAVDKLGNPWTPLKGITLKGRKQ
jgi:hypothetical protein